MAYSNDIFNVGDLVRVSGQFTVVTGGTTLDPTNVFMSFITPSGSLTTYTYGTDAQLVKLSTGNYYVDIDVTESGFWYYRFFSTGTGQAGYEDRFKARNIIAK